MTIEQLEEVLGVKVPDDDKEQSEAVLGTIEDDLNVSNDIIVDTLSLHSVNLNDVPVHKYIRAVKYVMAKSITNSNKEAWRIAFRDKVNGWVNECLPQSIIDSRISNNAMSYNRLPLVNKIENDSMLAMHIQYSGLRHEALMKNFKLMNGEASASKVPVFIEDDNGNKVKKLDDDGNVVYREVYQTVSPTVQQLASKTILEHTAIPIESDKVGSKDVLMDSVVEANKQMANALHQLALQQREALLNGADVHDVQVIGDSLLLTDDGDEVK